MSKFKDIKDDYWAREAIEALAEKGYVNGYEDGTFHPNAPITRAEVATILSRIIDDEGK